jgi:hypothetical protein
VLPIGNVLILLHPLRGRCIVTTYDPDSLAQDVDVLRDIGRRFGGKLALDSAVLAPGPRAGGRPRRGGRAGRRTAGQLPGRSAAGMMTTMASAGDATNVKDRRGSGP